MAALPSSHSLIIRDITMKIGIISISVVLLVGCLTRTTAFVIGQRQHKSDVCCRKSSISRSTCLFSSITPTENNLVSNHLNEVSNHLNDLTVLQLKALLRHQGLKVGGNKADLVERLLISSDGNEEDTNSIVQKKKEIRTKKQKIATIAKIVKKKRATLLVNEGIPSPSLNRQVESRIKAVKNEESKTVNNDDTTATSTEVETNGISFSDIEGLSTSMVSRLAAMGITVPTPIQQQAIPIAIKGRDILGTAQTGTGKTLAFGLPLITRMLDGIPDTIEHRHSRRPIRGLVLAPTRELANQIAVELGTLMHDSQLNTFVVVGGTNINTNVNKLKAQRTDLLVATPGRLIDLMGRGALSLRDTSFLVLDEADLMLDMGFSRDLNKIAKMLPKGRQTMLFSATMSKEINAVANDYLTNPERISVARAGKTADKIKQEVHYIKRSERTNLLLSMLRDHSNDRAIVFGRTKHGMERLSKTMIANGIKAASIHGNKSQPARDRALAAFKSGEIKVLVATDVAARGLDIPDVKRVYNFELSHQSEAYVHRIGRTARAGKEGMAISFCAPEDMDYIYYIQKLIKMKIPVASGQPFTKSEMQDELEMAKANKAMQEMRRRENRNQQGDGRGGGRGGRGNNKQKRRRY